MLMWPYCLSSLSRGAFSPNGHRKTSTNMKEISISICIHINSTIMSQYKYIKMFEYVFWSVRQASVLHSIQSHFITMNALPICIPKYWPFLWIPVHTSSDDTIETITTQSAAVPDSRPQPTTAMTERKHNLFSHSQIAKWPPLFESLAERSFHEWIHWPMRHCPFPLSICLRNGQREHRTYW